MSKTERLDSESGRTYRIPLPSGEIVEYPSVTTILGQVAKPWLVPWASKCCAEHLQKTMPLDRLVTPSEFEVLLKAAKNQHNWIKEDASDVGSQAHALVEAYLKEGVEPTIAEGTDERVVLGVQKYINWWKERDFSPVEVEMVVYNHTARFAGTLDCVAVEGSRLLILDLKTSNFYDPIYSLQAVAYRMAYEEMTGCEIDDVYVVRVGKDDAEIDIHHVPKRRHAFLYQCFLGVRQYYQFVLSEREIALQESEARKAAKAEAKRQEEASAKEKKLAKRQATSRMRPV